MLIYAIKDEDHEKLRLLFKLGVNINTKIDEGEKFGGSWTPLMHALVYKNIHIQTIEFLLSMGLNPLLTTKGGETIFNFLSPKREGQEEIKKLIELYTHFWKDKGPKAPKIIRSFQKPIRDCKPDQVYRIFQYL